MIKRYLFALFILATTTTSFADTNDCVGDCSHNSFETKVLPNRKPAVVLQEEIESITKVNRSPAVVEEQPEETKEKQEKVQEKVPSPLWSSFALFI